MFDDDNQDEDYEDFEAEPPDSDFPSFGQLRFAGDAPRWFTALIFAFFVLLMLAGLLLL